MEQFKEKVKALRGKRGWSQEDLAREIDVSLSQFSVGEIKWSSSLVNACLKGFAEEVGIYGE